jgi:mannan endo-1,4-beta-mannosidase
VIDWNALVTPGTLTNARLNACLDSIAAGIYDLASAGVTVIYRPYHESDGGWFWWGTASGDAIGGANPTSAQFIALWRYTHDYISNKPGPNGQPLGNKIAWAFTGVDQTNGVLNNWPDNAAGQYVDIVGNDIYTNTPGNDPNGVARYNAEVATGKVTIVPEFGPETQPFDETTLISALKTQYPKVVLFQHWSGQWGIDNMQNAKAALSDPYVLNRGLAPTIRHPQPHRLRQN